jgi:hypothetical protein
MLPFEALVIGYLAFFVVAAPFARAARRKQVRTALGAALLAVAVYMVASVFPLEVRLWLPFLYIPLGYWIPVALVPSTRGGAFEAWLRRTDQAVRDEIGITPRWLTAWLELGYLACFPAVPIAFAVVWTAGSHGDVARYWLAVLTSGYACYITLPWLVSRPPRLVDGDAAGVALTTLGSLNRFVLGRVSHSLNTFPSGHVAVTVAAAIVAGKIWPASGVVLGAVAAAVALGAFAGRYHYFADVVLGAGVGAAASL